MRRYGTDGYGRYVEIDGERYAVEPWPFRRPFRARILARISVIKWHWHKGWGA